MAGLFGGGGGSSRPAPTLNTQEFKDNSRRMHDGRRGRRTVMTSADSGTTSGTGLGQNGTRAGAGQGGDYEATRSMRGRPANLGGR
jgi:hypothetical protein